MKTDTGYINRVDERTAIPITLQRIGELIATDNPITTINIGLAHFEYHTYPEIALREAIMNAVCHADYKIPSPIMVKHYEDKVEITNPGSFIGGITPDNILHHPPVSRNLLLVNALLKLRLVNRSSLGISRMYQSLLSEGKEPPIIQESGESVIVTFTRCKFNPNFRSFIEKESRSGHIFTVDELIILRYLLYHREMETSTATKICQRDERTMLGELCDMEFHGYVERGGTGRGTYWVLTPAIYKKLSGPGHPERSRRIDWEAAKSRVLSMLINRARRGEQGLSNKEIRQVTFFDRNQAYRLMEQLRKENPKIKLTGRGKYAKYIYKS